MDQESQFTESFFQKKQSLSELIDEITPAIYGNLKLAVELGKWPDGKKLDADQLQHCMQAVILYEAKCVPEQDRTGFDLPTACSSQFSKNEK